MEETACYGLDFGTSSIKLYRRQSNVVGQEKLVLLSGQRDGSPMSTVVTVREDGAVVVGDTSQVIDNPRTSFLSFKRVIRDPESDALNRELGEIGGRMWTPRDLISEVLKEIVTRDANNTEKKLYIGPNARYRIVMSIPVYFGQNECDELVQAVESVGIDGSNITFIDEPLAAAIGLGNAKSEGLSLLIDMGAGTLDLVLFELKQIKQPSGPLRIWKKKPDIEKIDALAKHGVMLGGDDFDDQLVAHIVSRYFPGKVDFDTRALHRTGPLPSDVIQSRWYYPLKLKAQIAKESLFAGGGAVSEPVTTDISPGKSYGVEEPVWFTIDRDGFDSICGDLLKEVDLAIEHTLQKAGKKSADVANVYMVGGSCLLPAVKDIVVSKFPGEGRVTCNDPIGAIGKGDAKYAYDIERKATFASPGGIDVRDTTKHSYGIYSHVGDKTVEIIPAGSEMDREIQAERRFGAADSMQDNVRIEPRYKGDRSDAKWRQLRSNGHPVEFVARIEPREDTSRQRFIAKYKVEPGERNLTIIIEDTAAGTEVFMESIPVDFDSPE